MTALGGLDCMGILLVAAVVLAGLWIARGFALLLGVPDLDVWAALLMEWGNE